MRCRPLQQGMRAQGGWMLRLDAPRHAPLKYYTHSDTGAPRPVQAARCSQAAPQSSREHANPAPLASLAHTHTKPASLARSQRHTHTHTHTEPLTNTETGCTAAPQTRQAEHIRGAGAAGAPGGCTWQCAAPAPSWQQAHPTIDKLHTSRFPSSYADLLEQEERSAGASRAKPARREPRQPAAAPRTKPGQLGAGAAPAPPSKTPRNPEKQAKLRCIAHRWRPATGWRATSHADSRRPLQFFALSDQTVPIRGSGEEVNLPAPFQSVMPSE